MVSIVEIWQRQHAHTSFFLHTPRGARIPLFWRFWRGPSRVHPVSHFVDESPLIGWCFALATLFNPCSCALFFGSVCFLRPGSEDRQVGRLFEHVADSVVFVPAGLCPAKNLMFCRVNCPIGAAWEVFFRCRKVVFRVRGAKSFQASSIYNSAVFVLARLCPVKNLMFCCENCPTWAIRKVCFVAEKLFSGLGVQNGGGGFPNL